MVQLMHTVDFYTTAEDSMARPRELGAKRYKFTLRITDSLKKKIDLYAEYEGVTFSEAVTLLITKNIDEELQELKDLKSDNTKN